MSRAIPSQPRRILLIKSHSAGIGDILRSSAAWAALKKKWPDVELHLVFLTRWPGYPSEEFIREHFLLSSTHFLPMPEGRLWGMRGVGPRTWGRLLPELRRIVEQIRPDLIIDHEPFGVETTIAARWMRRFCAAPIVGVNQVFGRGLLYDIAGPSLQRYARQRRLGWPMDYTERDFAALDALGISRGKQPIVLMETPVGQMFREELQQRLPERLPVIGLNIGCGTVDALNRRPSLDFLLLLMNELNMAYPHCLILTGAPDEHEINVDFMKRYKDLYGEAYDVINLAGETTLSMLTGVINMCSAFISSDSGPYHMAVGLGVQTVGLFNVDTPEALHINVPFFIADKSNVDKIVAIIVDVMRFQGAYKL